MAAAPVAALAPLSPITGREIQAREGERFAIEGLTLYTPRFTRLLVRDLTLQLQPGDALLITGASGLVGSRVVRRLLPAHQSGKLALVAAARNERQQTRCAELGIGCVHLDFDDPASVRAAVAEGLPALAEGIGPLAEQRLQQVRAAFALDGDAALQPWQ